MIDFFRGIDRRVGRTHSPLVTSYTSTIRIVEIGDGGDLLSKPEPPHMMGDARLQFARLIFNDSCR
jgi:hypothetical protein